MRYFECWEIIGWASEARDILVWKNKLKVLYFYLFLHSYRNIMAANQRPNCKVFIINEVTQWNRLTVQENNTRLFHTQCFAKFSKFTWNTLPNMKPPQQGGLRLVLTLKSRDLLSFTISLKSCIEMYACFPMSEPKKSNT